MKKREVCLIFGGKSEEYDISLLSTECILKNIDREKYIVTLLGITREGKWYIYKGSEDKIRDGGWELDENRYPVFFCPGSGIILYGENLDRMLRPHIALPMVHGGFGEDGRIRGLLDIAGIRCAGVGVEGAAFTFNKHITKLIAKEMSVPVADFYILHRDSIPTEEEIARMGETLGYPLFVKADSSGSSVGVYRVKEEEELFLRINDAFSHSCAVLLEREIRGIEAEIGVIEKNGEICLGRIGQINHTGEFYDYDSKYKKSDSVCIIPAKISEKSEKYIKEYSKRLFYGAMCHGFCRMDFFVSEDGNVIFNEINSIPGFTSGSMFPMLMQDKERGLGGVIDDMLL